MIRALAGVLVLRQPWLELLRPQNTACLPIDAHQVAPEVLHIARRGGIDGVTAVGRDENAVADDRGARPARPRQRRSPDDVFGGRPTYGQPFLVADAKALWSAELAPFGGDEGRCRQDETDHGGSGETKSAHGLTPSDGRWISFRGGTSGQAEYTKRPSAWR